MGTGRLHGLDALRGLAAVLVVLVHFDGFYKLGWHIDTAALAVDFFFMLSGYVMARTYEERLKSGQIGTRDFIRARYRRLWPTLAIGTLLGLLHLAAMQGLNGPMLLALCFSLAMLPNVTANYGYYPFNGPAWSLFYEILANVLHGAVFAKAGSRTLLALAALSTFMIWIGTRELGHVPRGTLDPFYSVFRVTGPYLIGIVLYRKLRDGAVPWIPFWAALGALPAYMAVTAMVAIPLGYQLFVLVIAPLMVVGGLNYRRPAALASASGGISYPLYATHMPVLLISVEAALHPAIAFALAMGLAGLWLVEWKQLAKSMTGSMAARKTI
jgi:peptidoglycan/LPS O-acetylase OafA/YrhL